VDRVLVREGRPLVPPGRVYFELTKEAKLARLAEEACDVFVDDLPEILLAPGFPDRVRPILFDPEGHHRGLTKLTAVASWQDIRSHLDAACTPTR
jgi:hypothetical protein